MALVDDTTSRQRVRIYRVATLGTGIFVHLMVCWTVLAIGYLNVTPMAFLGLASVSIAGFGLIALLISIEWNLSLEDPDMAVAQMVWALTIVIITAQFAMQLKPVVLMAGLAMIVIGAHRLDRAQQILVAAYGLLLYIASVAYLTNIGDSGWVTELVLMIAFGLVLVFGPVLYKFERSVMEDAIAEKNVELGKALEQIREMAVRDELTGSFNRRHLMEVLSHEKAMADRKSYSFSVCFVDLDFFKTVNDRFGHQAGDEVLKNFARIAGEVVREVDCVARIGGEEFVLVLAGTSQADALRASERLAQGLSSMPVSGKDPAFRITASVGITEYRTNESIQQALDRADSALYEAKRTGRNKAVVAGEDLALVTQARSG
jgi:diguanylate cyclase (GGDEF)-like protein